MSPHLALRPAVPADADALADLIAETWPYEAHNLAQIARAIAWEDGHVLVAEAEDRQLLGFIAAFLTIGAAEVRRWELDLMAVTRTARGLGIATALVNASLTEGAGRGATLARGLIAEDNAASQRTVARFGLTVSGSRVTPCVAEAHPDAHHNDPVGVLPVETLTYSGLWVEPPLDASRLNAARRHALAAGRVVGALLPCDDDALLSAAEAAGYVAVADRRPYRWWSRPLGPLASSYSSFPTKAKS